MTFSVTSALDQYVASQASIREPDGKLHPSALFGCDRKTVYEMRGTEETNPRDARSKRTLFVGTKWHEIVQAAIVMAPDVDEVYVEVPIEIPELNIVGAADVLTRIGARWELTEIKSISSQGFKWGLPKEDHVMQAATYMMGLRNHGSHQPGCPDVTSFPLGCIPPLGNALDRIRMVYVSKDDLLIDESFVDWSAETEQKITERANRVMKYIADPTSLPPRMPFGTPTKKNPSGRFWLCGFCPFLDKCYDHDPDELLPDPDLGN